MRSSCRVWLRRSTLWHSQHHNISQWLYAAFKCEILIRAVLLAISSIRALFKSTNSVKYFKSPDIQYSIALTDQYNDVIVLCLWDSVYDAGEPAKPGWLTPVLLTVVQFAFNRVLVFFFHIQHHKTAESSSEAVTVLWCWQSSTSVSLLNSAVTGRRQMKNYPCVKGQNRSTCDNRVL